MISFLVEVLTYPFRRRIYGKSDLENFSNGIQKYMDSMQLSTGLPAAEGFNNYVGARISTSEQFSGVKAPDGKPISEKLGANTDQARDAKAAIDEALLLSPSTSRALVNFNADIAAVTALIQDKDANYNPADVVSFLQGVKGKAVASITKQHETEKKALLALFDPAVNLGFINNLKASLGGEPTDDQIKQVKSTMVGELEKSQTKELAAFTKNLDEPIKKMHTEAQKERDRITFLANLYENNKKMRAVIDQLAEDNKQKDGSEVVVALNGNEMSAKFKGINVKDLKTMETVTGRSINMSADGTFTMKLPNRFFSSSYYRGGLNLLKADMRSIAQGVKASGYEYITMSVTHKDKDHALVLAREAYEACRATGFDASKITIEVNGKKMTPQEIFAENPSALQAANAQGDLYATKSAKKSEPVPKEMPTAEFRELIKARRNAAEVPEQQEEEALNDQVQP